MQKLTSKKLIVATFLAGVVGLSSAPLGASALSYHNNNWNRQSQNDHRRDRITDRDARNIAQNMFPEKRFERVNNRVSDNDRDYDVTFFDGCHVVVRGDDGRVMRTYYQW